MRNDAWRVGALVLVLAGSLAAAGRARAAVPPAGHVTHRFHDFAARTAAGGTLPLGKYRGRALLVVNTASRCGFTPQYAALETLYRRYRARGFVVLAFPANNFLHQEPGSDAEIQKFCSSTYDVTFPVFAKLSVRGRDIAPLYAWLTRETPFPGEIGWNFTKFVIAPDGRVLARFDSGTDPLSKRVTDVIEGALPHR
jgi:glutathione peroxidase